MSERRYRVVWVTDVEKFRRRYGVNPTNTSGVHCPGPFTHEQACTVLRKMWPQPERRDLVEEIVE